MDFVIEGDALPKIPPGNYDMKFDHYETRILFGRAHKVVLWFSIVEMGAYFETRLARYYNASRIIGKPQLNGGFKVGMKTDFLREFVSLFHVSTKRLDRIPMSHFDGKIIRARVATVTKGSKQRDIPDELQYSVVSELLKVKAL